MIRRDVPGATLALMLPALAPLALSVEDRPPLALDDDRAIDEKGRVCIDASPDQNPIPVNRCLEGG